MTGRLFGCIKICIERERKTYEHKHQNVSEYDQEIPQINPRHREEETLIDNSNTTVRKNTKHSKQPSLPQRDDPKTKERTLRTRLGVSGLQRVNLFFSYYVLLSNQLFLTETREG